MKTDKRDFCWMLKTKKGHRKKSHFLQSSRGINRCDRTKISQSQPYRGMKEKENENGRGGRRIKREWKKENGGRAGFVLPLVKSTKGGTRKQNKKKTMSKKRQPKP